jgi:threonine dehydrogenase-like Zn-dependent dehydrogenase
MKASPVPEAKAPAEPLIPARAPATMRAAVLAAPGVFEIREAAVPAPGKGQALIRLEGCGVCASNLPPWEGRPWFSYPMAPGALGHEGWGVVEATGEGVTRVKRGDRVACLSGNAYAEYDLAAEDALVALPDFLDGMPFPGEPLACAVNAFRRSRVRAGETVAVVGVGFLGALLAQLALRAGARVIAFARRPFARELALSLGAEEAFSLDDRGAAVAGAAGITGGTLCDVVLECAGKQESLDLAGDLCRERGTLVVAGYHQDGTRQVNMQMWNWRGLDVVNAHERDPAVYADGLRRAVRAVGEGALAPRPLLTHKFSLERLGEALRQTRERPEGFLKAWIEF